MKRIISITIVLVLLFCCACQPTPKETVITEKNQIALIEKAKREPNSSEQVGPTVPPDARYRDSFSDNSGKLTVDIDATVVSPAIETWSVTRVGKAVFTGNQVRKVLTSLTHNE